MLSFMQLGDKEIINVLNGQRIGYADDVEFDETTRQVTRLIIFGKQRLFGLGGRGEDVVVEWEQIRTIGEDIILVEAALPETPHHWKKRKLCV